MTALVISLREGLEAALIVGILLGALKQLGRPESRPLHLDRRHQRRGRQRDCGGWLGGGRHRA